MKNGRKLGLLVAVLVVGVMAAPTFAASGVTVGDFVKNVATAMRLPAADATTAEAALRSAGYSLPRLDRSATLTQGAVAAIASSVGLNVASSNPAAAFSQSQVDRFMTSMSSNLNAAGSRVGAGDDQRNSTESSRSHSGKGKKKPHSKSPKKPKKPKKPKHPRSNHHHHHHHGRW